MNPVRIQLSRVKGWRKPSNTVVVSRPSEFGNPFRIFELIKRKRWTLETLIGFGGHVFWGSMYAVPDECKTSLAAVRRCAVESFELWLNGDTSRTDVVLPPELNARIIQKLKGKNLACWCPLDQPCHADDALKAAQSLKLTTVNIHRA